jgi:protein-disulfide isomerase
MKRILAATIFATFPLAAFAQGPTLASALKQYAARSLAQCPAARIDVAPVPQRGPSGFDIYTLTQESSDSSCQRKTYLLHSMSTQQVLIGTIFALPPDGRSTQARVASVAGEALKEQVTATIAPFPLPDGLHAVSITKQAKGVGAFSYHGFVDASGNFLIVGTRGSLNSDPGKTLVESIGLTGAMRRGNPMAKVTIVELSDFQCPTCARAHKKVEPIIAKNLNKINYYRVDLPLFEHHEWALQAALAARALGKVAPAKYWSFANFVFENQETIEKQPFDTTFKNWIEDNDVSWKAVEKIYRAPSEKAALLDQVSRAFDNGIMSTPTYIINGQILGFGPEGSFTVDAIKKAVGAK